MKIKCTKFHYPLIPRIFSSFLHFSRLKTLIIVIVSAITMPRENYRFIVKINEERRIRECTFIDRYTTVSDVFTLPLPSIRSPSIRGVIINRAMLLTRSIFPSRLAASFRRISRLRNFSVGSRLPNHVCGCHKVYDRQMSMTLYFYHPNGSRVSLS